jgi:uncharacterized protein (TIGR02466 family)
VITYNLFPTAVGKFTLGRDFTEKELKFIKDQATRPNSGNTTSVDNNLFECKELKDVAKFCHESMNAYLKEVYAPKHKVGLEFTQSWANYTEPGQFHHKHSHPNSFVSGVLYINADQTKDRIYFYKGGYQQIQLPTDNFNLFNSESWWFEVATGDLMLFPSSLTHMVETVKSDKTRISISFNTFPKGYVGEDLDLTGLHL